MASQRFIRNIVWAVGVCSLFLCGLLLRTTAQFSQLAKIEKETVLLYQSVLGRDIGSSPYGRLQFEQGKLAAQARIGIDPFNLLVTLSKPADMNLRVDQLMVEGLRGEVHGVYLAEKSSLEKYVESLRESEQFVFHIERTEKVEDGVAFILSMEPRL